MTRQRTFLTYGITSLLVYIALWTHLLPLPFLTEKQRDEILPCLPWNALVTLGSYCLWELGWGVLTFGECEGAHASLLKEIEQARIELRAKGVSVD